MLLILILLFVVYVNSLNIKMSIVSNEMRNICEGLSKDVFMTVNEKHPFCDDITKQYWLAIAGIIINIIIIIMIIIIFITII